MDNGHVRNITWAKDNGEKKWVAYNRLRGQYMSALEHAVPERFFNDPAKCNAEGTTPPVLGLPVCPQGISAVKAIGLAASQGQKIYTITPEVYANNPNIVDSNLSAHSQSTKQGIQNALDAGMEVTVHDAPIAQSGWTGSGYTFIDPQTGAGGYIIDGGTNGSVLPNSPIDVVGRNSDTLAIILFGLGVIALAAKVTIIIGLLLAVTAFVISSMAFMAAHLAALDYASNCPEALPCIEKIFMTVFLINTVLSLASLAINPAVAIAMAFSGLLFGDSLAQAAGMRCTNIACPRTT